MGAEPAARGLIEASPGARKPRRESLVALALIPVVVLGMLLALLSFELRAGDAESTEDLLIDAQLALLSVDATVLDYLPAAQDPQPPGSGGIDAALLEASSSVGALAGSDAGPQLASELSELRTYLGDASQVVALRRDGFGAQALALYRSEAAPAFDALQAGLLQAVSVYHARAEGAEHLRKIGSLATLVLGALIVGLVVQRSQRQRRLLVAAQSRESALRDTERRFLSLMEGSSDPVTVLDRDARVTFQSASIERLLGWGAAEMLGKEFSEFLDPRSAAELAELIAQAEAHPERRQAVTWRVRKADGTMLDVEAVLAGRFDEPDIGGVLINVRDISERLALEEALRHRAFHDALTSLPNRTLFEDRLEHALHRSARSGQTVCVLLADLDDFQDVNNSFGHAMGDQVLLQVSMRLASCLRAQDTLARVGGDAFAILVELTDEDEAAAVAERVVAALTAPISLEGVEVFAHASIGIATGSGVDPGEGDRGAAGLLVEADLAMHEAKQRARGGIHFYTTAMHADAMQRMEIRSDLERGLSRGEFVLHYQPIVALWSGALVGAEALVRWRHPERGLVSPAEFIPTAEKTGMIRELGRWVMEEACAEASGWPAPLNDGPAPHVSVNVAGLQLRQPGFVAEVTAALDEAGLDPDRLVIEVTESVLIEGNNGAKLSELQRMGVVLAIDDFGTGFSSLSYLQQFNMDVLKIDKSFIDHLGTDLGTDAKDAALVAAMVGIGASLGMTVVAEGIEHPEQVDELRALDCDLGQGYLFSKPIEATALRAILDRHGPVTSGARQKSDLA